MFSLIIKITKNAMKTEKIVISFIAVIVGIIVAGVFFYFYQQTKIIPASQTKVVSINPPTPTPKSSIFLVVDKPTDEEVVDTKTITVSGRTTADATVLVSTDNRDEILTPATNGNFSTTVTLDLGGQTITVVAIAPNGEEIKVVRTITYSTETF